MTEQEMIYLYRSESLSCVRDILHEKYQRMIEVLTTNLVYRTFAKPMLDNEDFLSYSYLSLIECLKVYNIKQIGYSFAQSLAMINRRLIIRYGGNLLAASQTAINSAINNREIYDEKTLTYATHDEERKDKSADDDARWEILNKFLKPYSTLCKRVIRLRGEGWDNQEIARKLHISRRRVCNTYTYVARQFRLKNKNVVFA
jgi:RNA polymerase sigma factor (sigma-70 family)